MIRHSPCEFYTKFLIVHPDGYDNDSIRSALQEQQLDHLGDYYLDRLRGMCVPPEPFYPGDPTHSRSQRFLIREKIHRLFNPDESMRCAFKLLNLPRAKEFIEAMLLSGAPASAVASALRSQRHVDCTAEAVDRYRHFFWNTELLDSTETRAVLRLRASWDHHGGGKALAPMFDALEKASHNDARRVAAELPASPLSAMLSQMRMGVMPGKIELAKVLETARIMAAVRAAEAASMGDFRSSTRALEWSVAVKNMTDTLEQVVRPDEEMREQLTSLVLQTDNRPVPTLKELSQGNHTVEMEPVKQEEESESSE